MKTVSSIVALFMFVGTGYALLNQPKNDPQTKTIRTGCSVPVGTACLGFHTKQVPKDSPEKNYYKK